MDVIVGVLVGVVFSLIISTGIISDSVSFVDMSNVKVAISKCPDHKYVDLVVIGKPNSYHEETKITCLDGSVVIVKVESK